MHKSRNHWLFVTFWGKCMKVHHEASTAWFVVPSRWQFAFIVHNVHINVGKLTVFSLSIVKPSDGWMLLDHEPVDRTPPPCGEVSPIPSGNLGSEGSKTGCLPIFKRSEHWVTAPARSGGQFLTQNFFLPKMCHFSRIMIICQKNSHFLKKTMYYGPLEVHYILIFIVINNFQSRFSQ